MNIVDKYILWRDRTHPNKFPEPIFLRGAWNSFRCPWWVFGPASWQPWQFVKDFTLHMTMYGQKRRGLHRFCYAALHAYMFWHTRTATRTAARMDQLDEYFNKRNTTSKS